MEIELRKLKMEHFKGVPLLEIDIEPGVKEISILGDNGTGKTTCMDAFLWLLFNKNSLGKSDFEIKTIDTVSGLPLHNMDHAVEATLNIDGNSIDLRKVYKEKWTKKRGDAKKSFTGNVSEYFIDGVPTQKKEWDIEISNIIGEDIFRLITNPFHFNSLHWEKRREILLSVCGDILPEDVIMHSKGSENDLSELQEILGDRTIEKHKKALAAKKKQINERLKEIPARIDELDKSLVDIASFNVDQIETNIAALGKKIEDIKDDKSVSNYRKQIAELNADLIEANNEATKIRQDQTRELAGKINETETRLISAESVLSGKVADVEAKTKSISRNKLLMDTLRDQYTQVDTSKYNSDLESHECPKCGYNLNTDQEKAAEESFNKNKAATLEGINNKGMAFSGENVESEKAIKTLEKDIAEETEVIKDLNASLKALREEHKNIVSAVSPGELKANEKGQTIKEKIVQIQAKIDGYDAPDTVLLASQVKLEQLKLAEIAASKKTKTRIEELAKEETDLIEAFEETERILFLCEEFTKLKVDLLENNINKKFKLARFKLFEQQVNGGIDDTCITLYNNVPYGLGLNTGAEINVGLDIIRTLSGHYNVKAPLFIDHAESVTDIIETGTQTFKLVVSKDCEKLEVIYHA